MLEGTLADSLTELLADVDATSWGLGADERHLLDVGRFVARNRETVIAALRSSGAGAEMREAETAARELLIAEQTKDACADACRFMGDKLYENVMGLPAGRPEERQRAANAARETARICADCLRNGVKVTPHALVSDSSALPLDGGRS